MRVKPWVLETLGIVVMGLVTGAVTYGILKTEVNFNSLELINQKTEIHNLEEKHYNLDKRIARWGEVEKEYVTVQVYESNQRRIEELLQLIIERLDQLEKKK